MIQIQEIFGLKFYTVLLTVDLDFGAKKIIKCSKSSKLKKCCYKKLLDMLQGWQKYK